MYVTWLLPIAWGFSTKLPPLGYLHNALKKILLLLYHILD